MLLMVVEVFIVVEDWCFYQYDGVDGWGIVWVVVINFCQGFVWEGVSIIIQQLV